MVVWPWLVLDLCTVLALTQLGIRHSDWWRAGIRSTNLHIMVELGSADGLASFQWRKFISVQINNVCDKDFQSKIPCVTLKELLLEIMISIFWFQIQILIYHLQWGLLKLLVWFDFWFKFLWVFFFTYSWHVLYHSHKQVDYSHNNIEFALEKLFDGARDPYCLTAQSHYLNLCWPLIDGVPLNLFVNSFMWIAQDDNWKN